MRDFRVASDSITFPLSTALPLFSTDLYSQLKRRGTRQSIISATGDYMHNNNNNNNNNTLFNEGLQIKLQLVQLVSNLVLLSSRNILHHVITIFMQLTYFRHVVLCIYSRGCVTTHNIHKYITIHNISNL